MRLKWIICWFILSILAACDRNETQFAGYVEGETIYLASPYSGILKQLAVERGQHVEKGTLLFILDPEPQQFTVAQAQDELAQARNTLVDLQKPRRMPEISAIQAQIEQTDAAIALAKIRLTRFQTLFNKQATDRDSLDAAVANLQQQQALKLHYESNLALAKLGSRSEQIKAQQNQVGVLMAKLKSAQWELAQKTLLAPASGVIFDTYYRPGELVGTQQAVVSLLTPENIQIEFFVPLAYLSSLSVGQKIQFNCEGCAVGNSAVIRYISPDAEYLPPLVYSRDNNAYLVFRIKAHIAEPTLFKPGQPVTVTL